MKDFTNPGSDSPQEWYEAPTHTFRASELKKKEREGKLLHFACRGRTKVAGGDTYLAPLSPAFKARSLEQGLSAGSKGARLENAEAIRKYEMNCSRVSARVHDWQGRAKEARTRAEGVLVVRVPN